ncbi:MAG: TIGR03960 family B12-binding radical SAM protein [Acidobacteriota bacterium]
MLEKSLFGVDKPGRYVGAEVNARGKSFGDSDVRFALAFPDVYEVGMSHLGLKVLYEVLNRMEGVMADRVYAPWFDYEANLRNFGEPLCAIESEKPLGEFDFVGFSLQYELSYSNILTILDLASIPIESKERTKDHPWVIAGGPCAFNPEPLAEVFDFVVLGEAEEVLPEVAALFRRWRASNGSREDFLLEVRKIEGIYVPALFDVSYHEDGTVSAIHPKLDDYTHVKKRLVLDLDADSPIPERPLVPMLDIVHNRLGIEIARGCTRGCRFCQAGFIYRPVRERRPQAVLKAAEEAISSSGFDDLALLSLSTGDYCQIQALLTSLMERYAEEKVGVSFPSMRVGTLTPELMNLIKQVRKTGFTLAPEAGSERLRRVINKGILDDDLLSASSSAFALGWKVLKLYFMIGLPTEDDSDMDGLVDLSLKVWNLAKPSKSSVNVSVSTFVPKAMTPFQWVPQIGRSAFEDRLGELKQRLRKPGIRVKWHTPGHSFLEAVFARGDRRLFKALRRAWELGVRFDGWTEVFREDLWNQAFEETGLDPLFYTARQRPLEEVFPWDHLSAGVEKEFLRAEYERALAEHYTPDCRFDNCTGCGVCDHETVDPVLHGEPVELIPSEKRHAASLGEYLYGLRYTKLGKIRFFGQLEVSQAFSRAIRRAALPAAYTKGFNPHVRLSFVEALPLGMESTVEEASVTLTERVDPERLKFELNASLPDGMRIEWAGLLARRSVRAPQQKTTYRVSELSPLQVRAMLDNWSERREDTLVKKTKKGEARASLGEILLDVRQVDESSLEMDLYEGAQMCFRPMAILQHLLGEPQEELAAECRICKVGVSSLEGTGGN